MIRRQRAVIVVAVACAVLSTSGLVLTRFIKSPAQVAAETAPPAASLLTAVVTEQVLADTLIFRGTVSPADKVDLTPALSSAAEASIAVVSGVKVAAGDDIDAGQVVVEVSGRPVILLPGVVPPYRDLRPGMAGPDVRQLQAALKQLGYFPATPDGIFGASTKQAVSRLYQATGYAVPDTGGPGGRGDRAALESARAAVVAAQQAVTTKEQELAAARAPQPAPSSGPTPSEGPSPSPTDPTTTMDPATIERLERELADATAELGRAIDAENDLIAHTGPMVPAAEVVFVADLPARVLSMNAVAGGAVTPSMISISAGGLLVNGALDSLSEATLLQPGLGALVDSAIALEPVEATVTAIGAVTTPVDAEGNNGRPFVPVTVVPTAPLPDNWNGQDVRITVALAATDHPVLTVPVSAIITRADGQTIVSVLHSDGSIQEIVVHAGASAGGLVEVSAGDGLLEAGDVVVVGTNGPAS